uniref:Uncharacterized protein n=1 Tax=Mesocestoides corti TaxID=53468 RepID=A0A5K3G032_MESCO
MFCNWPFVYSLELIYTRHSLAEQTTKPQSLGLCFNLRSLSWLPTKSRIADKMKGRECELKQSLPLVGVHNNLSNLLPPRNSSASSRRGQGVAPTRLDRQHHLLRSELNHHHHATAPISKLHGHQTLPDTAAAAIKSGRNIPPGTSSRLRHLVHPG